MKLKPSAKPFVAVMFLMAANAYAADTVPTGTMHKNGSVALGKDSKAGKMPLRWAIRRLQRVINLWQRVMIQTLRV